MAATWRSIRLASGRYDPWRNAWTLDGTVISDQLLRELGQHGPTPGPWFQIVDRADGMLTVRRAEEDPRELARAYRALAIIARDQDWSGRECDRCGHQSHLESNACPECHAPRTPPAPAEWVDQILGEET